METQSIKLRYCITETKASGPERPAGTTGHGHPHHVHNTVT